MKVRLDRIDDDYLFEAKGRSGIPVYIDNKPVNEEKGSSPMELVLMGVGGCNAIDIISILKKQRQEVTNYHIEVEGVRKDVKEARPFVAMHVIIYLEGDIVEAKAKRAAALSFEKYCSVSMTMEESVDITYEIVLNGEKI